MAHYILIDQNSGYIWGDSADIDGKIVTGTPCEVAKVLDESIGGLDQPLEYEETYQTDVNATYDVYRADGYGSEQIAVIQNGQDADTINAVVRDCKYVTSIVRHSGYVPGIEDLSWVQS